MRAYVRHMTPADTDRRRPAEGDAGIPVASRSRGLGDPAKPIRGAPHGRGGSGVSGDVAVKRVRMEGST
jgi:hypothetical protein